MNLILRAFDKKTAVSTNDQIAREKQVGTLKENHYKCKGWVQVAVELGNHFY